MKVAYLYTHPASTTVHGFLPPSLNHCILLCFALILFKFLVDLFSLHRSTYFEDDPVFLAVFSVKLTQFLCSHYAALYILAAVYSLTFYKSIVCHHFHFLLLFSIETSSLFVNAIWFLNLIVNVAKTGWHLLNWSFSICSYD